MNQNFIIVLCVPKKSIVIPVDFPDDFEDNLTEIINVAENYYDAGDYLTSTQLLNVVAFDYVDLSTDIEN